MTTHLVIIRQYKVIPLGFEPRTHSLEGCCSNPTELRNLNSGAKIIKIYDIIKFE